MSQHATINYEILPAWTCPRCKQKNTVRLLPREHTATACPCCGTVTLVIFHGAPEVPNPTAAIAAVVAATGVTVDEIKAHTRVKDAVAARHLCCYVLYRICGLSYKDTGLHVDRDHSTVIHGVKRVEKDMRMSKQWRDLVTGILTSLNVAPDPSLAYSQGKTGNNGGNRNGTS